MRHEGFFVTPRSLFQTNVWKCLKPSHFTVFWRCVQEANWKEGEWWNGRETVLIKRGQFVTSYSKLASLICNGVGIGVVRRALKVLKNMGELEVTPTHHFTLITVVHYETYGNLDLYFDTPNDTPNDTVVTQDGHSSDTVATPIESSKAVKAVKPEGSKPKDTSIKIDPVAFQEHWNSHPSLKRCRSMTEGRRRQLAIRSGAKDFRENWEQAIDALAKSPWHTGETSGGWRASAKWFLQNDENWLKCLEGEDTAEARREYSKKRVKAQERAVLARAEKERGKDDISPEAQAFVDNLLNKTGVNDG